MSTTTLSLVMKMHVQKRHLLTMMPESRYATSVYGEDGRKVADQLWEETMAELRFAKVNEILDSM